MAQMYVSVMRNNTTKKRVGLKFQNNIYAIKRGLFNCVVKRHLPVQQQVLWVLFQISMICLLLATFSSLSTSFVTAPRTEIADVMHVIFIVTIGALPRVLEVVMLDSSEQIRREIYLRRLEDTINHYIHESEDDDDDETEAANRPAEIELSHPFECSLIYSRSALRKHAYSNI